MLFDDEIDLNNLDINNLNYFNYNNYENYNYKKITSNSKLFSNIDATYIINLENNGRLINILKEIKKYPTTSTIYIVINKGFKNCKKNGWVKTSVEDIIHCNYNIFKHSKNKNYNNILILEDDCIFNDNIKHTSKDIDLFLKSKNGTNFQYYLGCVPIILFPYNKDTYYNILSSGTHAVIFSKVNRDEIMKIKPKTISDWDVFNNHSGFVRYVYYKPLCYQLFPETENYNNWGINSNIIVYCIGNIFAKNVIKILKLDYQVEPGYSFFYKISKYSLFIILILFIISLFLILSLIKKLDKFSRLRRILYNYMNSLRFNLF